MAVLSAKRDADYETKKFQAALQGVDLDKESAKHNPPEDFDSFREKVMAKHQMKNPNDVTALRPDDGLFIDDSGELRFT